MKFTNKTLRKYFAVMACATGAVMSSCRDDNISPTADFNDMRDYEYLLPDHVTYPVADGVEQDSLNMAERHVLHSIFGDKIDARINKVYGYGADQWAYVAHSDPNEIVFCRSDIYSSNYADEHVSIYKIFVHEAMHSYELQHDKDMDTDEGYIYRLTKDAVLDDYGAEQKASMLADYAGRFLRAEKEPFFWCDGYKGHERENETILMNIVEQSFPMARKTRIALNKPKLQIQKKP